MRPTSRTPEGARHAGGGGGGAFAIRGSVDRARCRMSLREECGIRRGTAGCGITGDRHARPAACSVCVGGLTTSQSVCSASLLVDSDSASVGDSKGCSQRLGKRSPEPLGHRRVKLPSRAALPLQRPAPPSSRESTQDRGWAAIILLRGWAARLPSGPRLGLHRALKPPSAGSTRR